MQTGETNNAGCDRPGIIGQNRRSFPVTESAPVISLRSDSSLMIQAWNSQKVL